MNDSSKRSRNEFHEPQCVTFTAIIPAVNFKCFSSIVHMLLRVDAELVVEVSPRGMWLRALNDAKSAFAVVALDAHKFFSTFDVEVPTASTRRRQEAQGDVAVASDVFACKVVGKVNVFLIVLPSGPRLLANILPLFFLSFSPLPTFSKDLELAH